MYPCREPRRGPILNTKGSMNMRYNPTARNLNSQPVPSQVGADTTRPQ